jgi:hypothetical protein
MLDNAKQVKSTEIGLKQGIPGEQLSLAVP